MEDEIKIIFVKIDFIYLEYLKNLIKLYETEKNTNIKKNEKIRNELKKTIKTFILEKHIRWIEKVNRKNFVIIEKSYKKVKEILKENKEIENKIQLELIYFVNIKTKEKLVNKHYEIKETFKKYDVIKETLQTMKNNYIYKDIIKYFTYNSKETIKLFKKWLKLQYSHYIKDDNNETDGTNETNEKNIKLHKNKKYNIIKN